MIVGTNPKTDGEKQIRANNNSNEQNDGQLIARARGDPAAFTKLYRRHYDAVFSYCVHRLFERHTAEDITSVVFLSVVENFNRFKGDEKDFRNWLYKIATNEVNRHIRQIVRRNGLFKKTCIQVSNHPAGREQSCDELALLKQAVLTLKPRYQTIITLRFFENLKLTEIAEVLGSSAGTVRSQLARALAQLRKKIPAIRKEVSEND